MFPQYFIENIKKNVNLVNLIGEYTELTKAGPLIYKGNCPHPNHVDKDPSFRVWLKGYKNVNKINKYDSWACMVCHCGKKGEQYENKGSDCIAFIQWIEKKSWKDAVIYLANKNSIPIPTDKNEKLYKEKKNLAYSYIENLHGESLTYLKNRGLTEEDCFKWGIGFDGSKIVFPLLDRYKNVLAFTRRWLVLPIEKCNDKYKNSSNSSIFNKSLYLYGLQNIDENFPEIRISEGPMDVILADKYGLKNIFSSLGTAFTEGHIQIIKHYGMVPVFCMDGDDAGLKSINRSIDMLAIEGIYSKIVIFPAGKDLADMALEYKEGIEEYINDNAITYGNYLIQKELNIYHAKVNELKLKSYPKLVKVLSKVPTQEERTILKSFVKTSMGMDM